MRRLGVLAFVVGCGSVQATPDAAVGNGDSGQSDGQTVGEAIFELKVGGAATSGKPVVFSNADGSIAAEAMTDAAGLAKATIHAGAMVTVSIDSGTLVSIGGIQPGDHIVMKNPPPTDTTSAGIVSFSAASEAANKSYYRPDLGDDNYNTVQTMTTGPRTLTLQKNNLDAAGKLHMATGVYGVADNLIAYTFVTNVTPTLGQTTPITFPAYMTDVPNLSVMVTGAPAEANKLIVDSANEKAGQKFMPSSFAGIDSTTITSGNATVTVPYLGSFGDYVQTTATVLFSTNSESFTFARRVPRPASAFTIAAANMPPRLAAPAVDSSTVTRPKLSWTITGSGGDAIAVHLDWRNAANTQFTWHAYLPPDATSVTFPVVSSSMMAQAPNSTSFLGRVRVAHEDLEPLSGFAAFRVAPPIEIADQVLPSGMTSWVESETHKAL